MEFKLSKDIIRKEDIENIYKLNNIELIGNYDLDKLYLSLQNSHLVVSLWNNEKFLGYCRVISDGVYFGRIQELIVHPNIRDEKDIITDILLKVFENCPKLKTFHMNPGVYEKKEIYQRKHFAPSLKLRKIFWSIHEDEF